MGFSTLGKFDDFLSSTSSFKKDAQMLREAVQAFTRHYFGAAGTIKAYDPDTSKRDQTFSVVQFKVFCAPGKNGGVAVVSDSGKCHKIEHIDAVGRMEHV